MNSVSRVLNILRLPLRWPLRLPVVQVDPFHLTRDGDKLYGRGTTDCLGHVAMITDLMIGLASKRPVLSRTVLAIFM